MKLEFFNQPSNLTRDKVMVIQDGEYKTLRNLDETTIKILYLRLLGHPESAAKIRILKRHGFEKPIDQIRQFAICNFGRLDHINDLDEDGKLHFEFVPCQFRYRGCPYNGDICIKKF